MIPLKEFMPTVMIALVFLLRSNNPATFKKAVFITENSFTINQMEYSKFDEYIGQLTGIVKAWMSANPLRNYPYSDSVNFRENLAIYKFLKDTIYFIDGNQKTYKLLPYSYDFTDFIGRSDWGYMFITKLLATHKGNCHSLPYLYKILADDIGASCWLALAPNHIYIENRCRKIGWYNTELTSGSFPIDAWIMASGYLPLQAVQNGIYMDTLSNQQSIALCVLDLAKGYEHKTHNYYDGFILKCCDLSLQYFPLNVQAMLLKAETLKRIYEKEKLQKASAAKETYHQMEQLYVRLFDLGYREMPDKMYQQWLLSVVKERDKYSNKKLTDAIQAN
ncbi:hypothetical protein ACQ86N_02535 [Puia sp. P3]|uniref:hypothetical protein n=1 Tax=Puia sp. P3 TaxID=3423952 RepID=UPI003D66951A